MKAISSFELYFSYGQFSIFDTGLDEPFLEWSDQHSAQGFVRGDSIISVGTLLSHGIAQASVFLGTLADVSKYRRAIAIPMKVTSGCVAFSNPDAAPDESVKVDLPAGHYLVGIAQAQTSGDDREKVDIFFEQSDGSQKESVILLADSDMSPQYPLLERAPTT